MKDVSSGLSPVQNPLKTEANIKKRALTFCRGQRDVAIRGEKNKQITSLLPITSRTAQIPPPHPHLKCHPFPKQTKETLKHRGATSFAPFFFQPPFPNDTHFLHQFTTKPIPLDTYSVQTGFKKLVKKKKKQHDTEFPKPLQEASTRGPGAKSRTHTFCLALSLEQRASSAHQGQGRRVFVAKKVLLLV